MTPEKFHQLEDLYHSARKCAPKDRAALLQCADPEIRSCVERMLEVESSGGVLDSAAGGLLADLAEPITPGARLGPYRIENRIGAGGMGVVYRAVDTRLGREVALKVASEFYSERFQLEARAISTLNHPHICTLYDVGPSYLVMELLDGFTLAAELKKGPLEPAAAARYAAQIASALAEAHARGIVHRDLKPANIMLTRHGVKVLDFGLAKIQPQAATASQEEPTATGDILGTPAYMAPEQVEGREPGPSTDLFALGLVLYEMTVGRLPFPGASLGRMLASGSQAPVPAPSRERRGIPAGLDPWIAKLLQPDPANRPQSAAEVARQLSAIADRLAEPRSRARWRTFGPLAAALLLGLAAWLYPIPKLRESQRPMASDPATYTQLTSFTDAAVGPTLSRDGRMLAFYRGQNSFSTTGEIWVKMLPDGEPIQVTHDPRCKYSLAFSPDGTRIAYTACNPFFDTFTVSSLGGDSELLLRNSAGLSWLDDLHAMYSVMKPGGIHMGIVTSKTDGSDYREIYFPTLDRGMAHYSHLSPDKHWVLVAEMDPDWGPCRLAPFDGGAPARHVGPNGACTSAAWSPDGKWMYFGVQVSGRQHLWRQRFPGGTPEQLTSGSTEEAGIAMSPDGRSLITSIFTQQNAVWIHDPQGDRPVSTQGYAGFAAPVFSRDGKRIYYQLRPDTLESPAELWCGDLATGKSRAVLPGISIRDFDISPDEKDVAFSTNPPGQSSQLWISPLDRGSPPRKIADGDVRYPHFGANGEILFRQTKGKSYFLAAVMRDGTNQRQALPGTVLNVFGMSPDGKFIVVNAAPPKDRTAPGAATMAVPLDGGPARKICDSYCYTSWSLNGRYFNIEMSPGSQAGAAARTVAIPVPAGESLPELPPDAVRDPWQYTKIPGVKILQQTSISPGPEPSIYAYFKNSVHANLFRIPLR